MITKLHRSQKVTAGLHGGTEREREREGGKKGQGEGRRGRTRRLEGEKRKGELNSVI